MITKVRLTVLMFVGLVLFTFIPFSKIYAATSATLGSAGSYSVLGGETVTNTGTTTMPGSLGVSPGTAVTGDPVVGPPGTTHFGDAEAAGAQIDSAAAFGFLDQGCDVSYAGTQDLVGMNLVPGVYCADAFELSGTLTLSGSGVWIFKSASSLITSGTAKVVGGDPCNVWWRVASSATLGTNTSLIGNVLALTSISLQTGAKLDGRALAQVGQVSLDSNAISGPTCVVASSAPAAETSSNTSSNTSTPPSNICVADAITTVPIILQLKRVSATSVFLSWGPYAGLERFNIQYGPANGNWLYNVDVTGFSTTINDLPANQPFWFQVAARNDCAIGTYGTPKLVGQAGSVSSNVLGASVGLPNTGRGSKNGTAWEVILPGAVFVTALAYFLMQRKNKSLSKQ